MSHSRFLIATLLWLLPACSGSGGADGTTTTPVLTGLTVAEDGTFTVTGTNLEGPFEVVFLDGNGNPVAAPVVVDAADDGLSATGDTPEIPAPLSRVTVQVRIGGEESSSTVEAEVAIPCRTIDGMGNNALDPTLGSADIELVRMVPSAYADGVSALVELEEAVALYHELIEERPEVAPVAQSLGHALKTLGPQDEAVAA